MDRRGYLSVSAATTAGVAVAGAGSMWRGGPDTAGIADAQKGGGRALIAETVAARDLGGSLPFALSRFAEDEKTIAGIKRYTSVGEKVWTLSPVRDVSFHGFAGGAAGARSLATDQLLITAVHVASDGVVERHDLWSHQGKRLGGTSQSVLFTAHDDAFSGFEVTHIPSSGKRSSAFFNFMASGSGPQLKPGVYVLAGPRIATGLAPELARYGYSGDVRAPVRESRVLGLDFAYLSFAVHGEWV